MRHYLVWLARQMRQHSQSIFYLEHLQPDWLSSGWAQQAYTWLGIWLPDILIGCLMSFVIHLLFFSSGTGFDLLVSVLLGGVVGGLLCSRQATPSAVTPSRSRHQPLPLLATAGFLGLLVGLGLALLSSFDPFHSLSPPITGMSFGLATFLLTLLLVRLPPASQQANNLTESSIGTKRRLLRQMLTNDALRQSLLFGGFFGLSYGLCDRLLIEQFWGLHYGLIRGLSDGLSNGLTWGLYGVSSSLLLFQRPRTIVPTEILVWSWKRVWRSLKRREHMQKTLMLALVIGLRVGLIWGLSKGLNTGLLPGLSIGLIAGLITGLSVAGSYWLLLGLFQGVASTIFQAQQHTTPNQGIHHSGRNGLFLGLLAGIVAAVISAGGSS
jgi:hypothetical protein